MSQRDKLIILCAPFTVIVEWSSFIFAIAYFGLDFDQPISAFPYLHEDYAWYYSLTVSLIAILFAVFCLSLRRYWKPSFKLAALSTGLFLIMAWAQYSPNGGFWNGVHNFCANLGALGYGFILLQVSFRGSHMMRQAGMVFISFAAVNLIAIFLSVHVFHLYATWFQLLFMLTVQAWALYLAYYLWHEEPATQ